MIPLNFSIDMRLAQLRAAIDREPEAGPLPGEDAPGPFLRWYGSFGEALFELIHHTGTRRDLTHLMSPYDLRHYTQPLLEVMRSFEPAPGFIRETIVWIPRHGDEDWGVFLDRPGKERNDVAFAHSQEEAVALRDWLSEANPARRFEIRPARPAG